MVRKYKRVSGRKKWTTANLRAAIKAVRSDGLSVRRAASDHGIPRQTLNRHLMHSEEVKQLGRYSTIFTEQQENELVQHVLSLEKSFYGLTTTEIRKLAFDLAEKNNIPHPFNKSVGLAGYDWLAGFRKRHPELTLRTPEATSVARAQGFNKPAVDRYYDMLEETVTTGKFDPCRIYNVDETSVLTVRFVVLLELEIY